MSITETGPVTLTVVEVCHVCGVCMQSGETCFLLTVDYGYIDGYTLEYYVHAACLAQYTPEKE